MTLNQACRFLQETHSLPPLRYPPCLVKKASVTPPCLVKKASVTFPLAFEIDDRYPPSQGGGNGGSLRGGVTGAPLPLLRYPPLRFEIDYRYPPPWQKRQPCVKHGQQFHLSIMGNSREPI